MTNVKKKPVSKSHPLGSLYQPTKDIKTNSFVVVNIKESPLHQARGLLLNTIIRDYLTLQYMKNLYPNGEEKNPSTLSLSI